MMTQTITDMGQMLIRKVNSLDHAGEPKIYEIQKGIHVDAHYNFH